MTACHWLSSGLYESHNIWPDFLRVGLHASLDVQGNLKWRPTQNVMHARGDLFLNHNNWRTDFAGRYSSPARYVCSSGSGTS